MLSSILAGALLWGGQAASEAPPESFFVTAHYRDRAELQALASQFQHLIVDRRTRTVRLEADARDIDALRAAGIEVEIDAAATLQMRDATSAVFGRPGGRAKSISGYACYRTVEETYTSMQQLATAKPALAQVVDIGPSWQKSVNSATGYTMKVLKLSNSATDAAIPDKPSMVVLSSIHAREYTPAELMTRFGEWLVNGYGTDAEATWLMDNYRFHLVLQGNPDGRKKAETGLSWRKNTNSGNGGACSANSVGTDLNRNFPFHWSTVAGGSSGDPCNETYRGPVRASEPETQNIVRYVAGTQGSDGSFSGGIFPDRRADLASAAAPDDYRGLFMDIHSYSQLVLWPWGDTSSAAPNMAPLRTLGRRLAYFNSYRPQQSAELYGTDGATDDFAYGSLGVPAYTLELGVAFFENCNTFTSATLPNNLAALKYAARNLQAPYRLPAGPDTVSVSTSATTVAAGTTLTVTASVNDSRFNQSNGTEAVQSIASAAAYVDKLPWQSGAVAIPMIAVDGSFNTSSESVRVSINTTGLAAGPHRVYVQATDAGGKAGTPNAVLFAVSGSGGGNQPPVADFSFAATNLSVNFSDTSTDSDGTIASRNWSFGDGSSSTLANPSKTYAAAGTYTVLLAVTDNGGATHSSSKQVAVTSGGGNVLVNGVPATGLSGAKDAQLAYTLAVPTGASNLRFTTSGGTGDADLYVRFGSAPTTATYDCKSAGGSNAETCSIATAQAGTYHVRVVGYSAFSGLSLTGSYQTSVPAGPNFSNTTPFAIADNSTIESPIAVNGVMGNAPTALKVAVNITHTYQGDLKVDLVAPNGTLFPLWNRTGGGTDNIRQTFTVNASNVVANGTWKLRVNDNASGDTGTLTSWSLQF